MTEYDRDVQEAIRATLDELSRAEARLQTAVERMETMLARIVDSLKLIEMALSIR
jgi:uncharacterized coiled-coil protein SlyX